MVAGLLGLAGCRPDTVRIAYRPATGTRAVYRLQVRSSTRLMLADEPARETDDTVTLEADHTVLGRTVDGVRVQVRVRRAGSEPTTFVVQLDRAAQLQQVERIEGLPADVLGDVGITEIFPPGVGAPPDRALRAGERWDIDEPVRLPGTEQAHLTGDGRLVSLGVVHGRKVATTRSHTRLPATRTSKLRGSDLRLRGVEITDSTSDHDVHDGSIVAASSVTRGTFDVVLSPPNGQAGSDLTGRLTIEVRSSVTRLR